MTRLPRRRDGGLAAHERAGLVAASGSGWRHVGMQMDRILCATIIALRPFPSKYIQGDNSGRKKPSVDIVPTVPAAAGALL